MLAELTRPTLRWLPAFIDSLVSSTVIFGLCYALNPQDPLYINGPFPWPWFAVIYIALRYGLTASVIPLVLLGVYSVWAVPVLNWTVASRIYFVSGFVWVVVISVIRDKWQHEAKRWQELVAYNENQLQQLGKSYYVTRLSHDRLEESLVSKPFTLRGAFKTLHKRLAQNQGRLDAETGQRFLELLAEIASINQMTLHLYDPEHGQWQVKPLAGYHSSAELELDDPLVQYIMEYHPQRAVTLRDTQHSSCYILCCPLVNTQGDVWGVCAVMDMDFWAVNEQNCQMIAMLCSFFADHQWRPEVADSLLPYFHDCPQDFAHAIHRFVYFKRRFKLPSMLVYFVMDLQDQRQHLTQRLSQQFRATDFIWWRHDGHYDYCVVLLTFSSNIALEGFLSRINQWLSSNFYQLTENERIKIYTAELTGQAPEKQLKALME